MNDWMEAFKELKVYAKGGIVIKITMKYSKITIRTKKGESTEIKMKMRMRKEDTLSGTLLIMVLKYSTWNIIMYTLRTR